MLVLAPRSLLRSVWVNDIRKFAPQLSVSVADAANRAAAFEAEADVYVTNVDAVKWLDEQTPDFFERFDELVIDESTAYKHHTSQRSKAVARISKFFRNRCCLTGTPNGNTITDVWHQAYILDGGARLGNSFYRFRDSVCTPTQVGRNANALKWTDKEGAEEVVFSLLSDIVIRHKFEDCVDIPPNHQYTLDYELTPKQMRSYIELETSQMLTLRGKSPAILAINAAAVATKLLQVASGAVYDGMGSYQVIDTARYEMIIDLVEQRKHSLVIFLWKHQRDALIAEAKKRGVTYEVLDGETSDKDREAIVAGFQAGRYQVIFGHPKTVAHGYTLTRGTATIWASPTYDLEHFKQGSKRMHRIGQTQKTETIIIVAKGTIDEKAYELMEGKNARMKNLLDLFGTLTPVAPMVKKTKPRKVMAEV
jgi:SNF2 family DNA or RNA helicase